MLYLCLCTSCHLFRKLDSKLEDLFLDLIIRCWLFSIWISEYTSLCHLFYDSYDYVCLYIYKLSSISKAHPRILALNLESWLLGIELTNICFCCLLYILLVMLHMLSLILRTQLEIKWLHLTFILRFDH
jgi:hypothetical protein